MLRLKELKYWEEEKERDGFNVSDPLLFSIICRVVVNTAKGDKTRDKVVSTFSRVR